MPRERRLPCRHRVALLDFEFAAPGRPVYDVAHLARLCVPIDDDFDQARLGWRPADRPARLRLVADAYGLDRDGWVELLSAMNDAIARIEAAVRRSVAAGNPVSVELWNRTGGSERYDRRRRWRTDHYDQFAAALTYSAFVAVFPLPLPHVGATPRRKRSRSARATVPPKLTRPNDVCSSRRTAGLARASGSTNAWPERSKRAAPN